MKNKIFKSVMSVVAVAFTIASLSMIFAWYTNVNKVGEIDAESNDISITYTIFQANPIKIKVNIKTIEIILCLEATNTFFMDL